MVDPGLFGEASPRGGRRPNGKAVAKDA